MLGIIGHLDVVPADNTWTFDPFNATIKDNKIYGRGAVDDKGPVVAALYAMKVVHDTYKIDKRVRLILGLNEETNWKCIERYKETEEMPTVAFSPDANFPCIYAEKTIETIYLEQYYDYNPLLYIENISTNNNAINVVPKYCEITLGFDKNKLQDIESIINKILNKYNYNIVLENIDNSHIKLISKGLASHAARPEFGNNAISKLIIIVDELFSYYNLNIELLDFFVKHIGDDYTGKNLGIDFKDESGCLTLNTAQFKLENSTFKIGFNIRIPVTIDYNIIKDYFVKHLNQDITVNVARIQEPLYINKNMPLIQTLCNIFNDYNNSNIKPQAIGGGTYSRAFDNCASFGPKMPEAEDMCHKSDEYITIDNLLFCCKVYSKAILDL